MRNTSPNNQKGVALIVVLMLVALVAVIGTEMAGRLQLHVTRASNIKDNNQAYWYAMGAEQFAKKSIIELLERNNTVVSLEGGWSEEFTFPLEGGGIQAQLVDMQTCFNLNAINAANVNSGNSNTNNGSSGNTNSGGANNGQNNNTNAPTQAQRQATPDGQVPSEAQAFERLLTEVIPELDNYSKEVVRDSLIDWLDEDDELSQSGAENADYGALVNPYLAANASMVSKSELRLVNGVNPQWINALMPYVCVIPGVQQLKININTVQEAQAPILAALTGAPLSDIQSLIGNRAPSGYENVADFLAESLFANHPLSANQQEWFEVNTEYFLLHTKTRYNNASFAMSSLLKVEENDTVTVVRREFGGIR